jgi:hypothetical protein
MADRPRPFHKRSAYRDPNSQDLRCERLLPLGQKRSARQSLVQGTIASGWYAASEKFPTVCVPSSKRWRRPSRRCWTPPWRRPPMRLSRRPVPEKVSTPKRTSGLRSLNTTRGVPEPSRARGSIRQGQSARGSRSCGPRDLCHAKRDFAGLDLCCGPRYRSGSPSLHGRGSAPVLGRRELRAIQRPGELQDRHE